MISTILTRSGGPPRAALTTSAASRKYCGPIAAGVMAQSAFASWLPLLSNRCMAPRRMQRACPRSDVNPCAVDGPGQQALDAVNRLLVVIVAVRRSGEALSGGDSQLEEGQAATRLSTRDQEAHGERPRTDGLVGGIDVRVGRFWCH